MIMEDEERSAAYRDVLDVIHDQFKLALKNKSFVYDWAELRGLADAGEREAGLKLLPTNEDHFVPFKYRTSHPLDVNGERDVSKEVLSVHYNWYFAGGSFEVLITFIRGAVELVTFVAPEKIENLLDAGLPLKQQLEGVIVNMLRKAN